jgi:hypothetical protein
MPPRTLVAEVRKPKGLTPATFEAEFVRSGEPVVFKGLVAEFPACGWRFPNFAEHVPKHRVRACGATSRDGKTQYTVGLSIAELIEQLEADDRPGAPRADWTLDLLGELPELVSELPPPPVHRGAIEYPMFIGRDTSTPGHYHAYQHALICQIHGKKRVILYPPEDSAFLYPLPVLRETRHIQSSEVDFSAPDLGRFPKLASTHPREAILEPGDALFIPVHFWHAVYGIGMVMSANLFWRARFRDHRFPHPGLRTLAGRLRWDAWPGIQSIAKTAGQRVSGSRSFG